MPDCQMLKSSRLGPEHIGETPFSNVEALVTVQEDESHLNSILMLNGCVGERLTLEIITRYGSYKLVKTPSFGCKLPLWHVLPENNGSLLEVEHQGIVAFLMLHWVCHRFVTVREVVFGEDYGLQFCEGTCSEVQHGKLRVPASDQAN